MIGGPDTPGQRLEIIGLCPEEMLKYGPQHLTVTTDGVTLGETDLRAPGGHFRRSFPLPSSLLGRPVVEIGIHVSRTVRVGMRDYGVLIESLSRVRS